MNLFDPGPAASEAMKALEARAKKKRQTRSDFSIALDAFAKAFQAIHRSAGIRECTMDNDHKSAEIMFTVGETNYVLRLEEYE